MIIGIHFTHSIFLSKNEVSKVLPNSFTFAREELLSVFQRGTVKAEVNHVKVRLHHPDCTRKLGSVAVSSAIQGLVPKLLGSFFRCESEEPVHSNLNAERSDHFVNILDVSFLGVLGFRLGLSVGLLTSHILVVEGRVTCKCSMDEWC